MPLAMRVLSWLGKESVQQGDAYTFAVVQQVSATAIGTLSTHSLGGCHGGMPVCPSC